MPSLIELVEKINQGDAVEPQDLTGYQESSNSAERFLAHHAGATLGLRQCHGHLLEALQAIDFADRKVLEQYVGLCGFLGRSEQQTGPMVSFGGNAIARGETALGLEAISQAVASDLAAGWNWSREQANLIELGRLYASAGETIGWTPSAGRWSNTQTRIAYVTSTLADDEPSARAAAAFAGSIDDKKFRLGVYSTEAFCRRDKQQYIGNFPFAVGSARRGSGIVGRIKDSKATSWIAPTAGDMVTAALALADQLVADQTDVIIIDADPSDPIAGLIAGWQTAKAKLWIARRSPLFATTINAVCYLDPVRCGDEQGWWEQRGITATSIVEGVDLGAPIGEAPRRGTYGIPDSAVILTTAADDVQRTISPMMVDAIIDVLKKHPQAVYLLVGGGDTNPLRRRFDAAGVGKRVGYAGKRRDLPGFLKMADIYVAEFPEAAPAGVLHAMHVGLPAVAVAFGDTGAGIAASEFVGSEATVSGPELGAFNERLGRLIRDAAFRQQQGRALRRRIEQHFSYEQTARGLETLAAGLIGGESAARESESVSLDEVPAERKAA